MTMTTNDVGCATCPPVRYTDGSYRPKIMEFTGQYPVRGNHTFAFHCTGCNGRAYLQQRRDPRTGRGVMVPVALHGADAEYQPNHVKPREAVQIPVAYTLGQTGGGHHVKAAPLRLPNSGIQLDPQIGEGTLLTPDHPMHPANIRKRIQPVGLHDFAGR